MTPEVFTNIFWKNLAKNPKEKQLRSQIDFLKNEIKSGDYEDTKRFERKLNNDLHKIACKVVEILYEIGHNRTQGHLHWKECIRK